MIQYATFGQRFKGLLLDIAIDLIVLAALHSIAGEGRTFGIFAAWYLLHHVGFVTEGGTLGHRLVGLRIVRTDGERVPVAHAIAREAARLFLSLPPLGLGFLWMLDRSERRCWHDIIGGTVVVRDAPSAATLSPTWADDPPWRRSRHANGNAEKLRS